MRRDEPSRSKNPMLLGTAWPLIGARGGGAWSPFLARVVQESEHLMPSAGGSPSSATARSALFLIAWSSITLAASAMSTSAKLVDLGTQPLRSRPR